MLEITLDQITAMPLSSWLEAIRVWVWISAFLTGALVSVGVAAMTRSAVGCLTVVLWIPAFALLYHILWVWLPLWLIPILFGSLSVTQQAAVYALWVIGTFAVSSRIPSGISNRRSSRS